MKKESLKTVDVDDHQDPRSNRNDNRINNKEWYEKHKKQLLKVDELWGYQSPNNNGKWLISKRHLNKKNM